MQNVEGPKILGGGKTDGSNREGGGVKLTIMVSQSSAKVKIPQSLSIFFYLKVFIFFMWRNLPSTHELDTSLCEVKIWIHS